MKLHGILVSNCDSSDGILLTRQFIFVICATGVNLIVRQARGQIKGIEWTNTERQTVFEIEKYGGKVEQDITLRGEQKSVASLSGQSVTNSKSSCPF